MKRPAIWATLFSIVVVVTMALMAAELKEGTWTGTVTPPNGGAIEVSYKVASQDGATTIILETPMGSFDFENVKVEKDGFTFSWTPGGTPLDCTMKLQDDQSYKGICTDSSGGEGHLTMLPPK